MNPSQGRTHAADRWHNHVGQAGKLEMITQAQRFDGP
jgi:hypothetical protein